MLSLPKSESGKLDPKSRCRASHSLDRDLTMGINVKGVWWGCKYAILAMRKNPTDESLGLHTGGSIINVASFVAILGAATPQLACTLLFLLYIHGVDRFEGRHGIQGMNILAAYHLS